MRMTRSIFETSVLAAVAVGALLLMAACPSEPETSTETLTGVLILSAERHEFVSDDGDRFWVEATPLLTEFAGKSRSGSESRWKVTVEALTTRGGRYGHLGRWENELLVTRIIKSKVER